jgi:gluconokinase
LFDTRRYEWYDACLQLLDITPKNLPALASPRHIIKTWNREMAAAIGVEDNMPLIIGGGDGQLANVGVGAYRPGILALNVGTSAAVRSILSQPVFDPKRRLWTYVVDENLWVTGGMVSSGGMVYEWFLENCYAPSAQTAQDPAFGRADDLVASVPPGAEGLLFIPYLAGEQCPGWHPHTRGSFFGLGFSHKREHLLRAVLEGITRSIYLVSEALQEVLDQPAKEVRVTGGLAASPEWRRIAADMFGCPVGLPDTTQGSARGAAILASVALGIKSSIEEFEDALRPEIRVQPNAGHHAYYQQQLHAFRQMLDYTRQFGGASP